MCQREVARTDFEIERKTLDGPSDPIKFSPFFEFKYYRCAFSREGNFPSLLDDSCLSCSERNLLSSAGRDCPA
jgi:hypothetical protein